MAATRRTRRITPRATSEESTIALRHDTWADAWVLEDAPALLPQSGGVRALLLVRSIREALATGRDLVVLAETSRPASELFSEALVAGALDRRLELRMPDFVERRALLARLFAVPGSPVFDGLDASDDDTRIELATWTAGLTAGFTGRTSPRSSRAR